MVNNLLKGFWIRTSLVLGDSIKKLRFDDDTFRLKIRLCTIRFQITRVSQIIITFVCDILKLPGGAYVFLDIRWLSRP